MTNTHTYCPDCRKHIPDADIKWGYYLPEQRYGDNAHPAEHDEPTCPECGAELTEGEECKLCNEEFEPDKIKNGVCVECRAYSLIDGILSSDVWATITATLVKEYGVSDGEAHLIYKEQLRAYAE